MASIRNWFRHNKLASRLNLNGKITGQCPMSRELLHLVYSALLQVDVQIGQVYGIRETVECSRIGKSRFPGLRNVFAAPDCHSAAELYLKISMEAAPLWRGGRSGNVTEKLRLMDAFCNCDSARSNFQLYSRQRLGRAARRPSR